MKKLIGLTVLTLLIIHVVAQNSDSNKIVVSDLGDRIQIKFGDSIISYSYEYMAQNYLDKGIRNGSEGDYEAAISNFNLALLYIENNPEIYYNRGLAYYYLEDYSSSIHDLTTTIQLDSFHYEALNQRGIIYSKNNDFDIALDDFNQAIQQFPERSNAYFNKGINSLLMDDWDEACKLLEIALEKGDDKAAGVLEQYCY